jgi:hypothetical protein
MKIVINKCYGGFGLSEAAYQELGIPWDGYGYELNEDRANPALVAVVEKLGYAASGGCAKLAVIEIPDGVDWEIDEYDGFESVHEKHRSWN